MKRLTPVPTTGDSGAAKPRLGGGHDRFLSLKGSRPAGLQFS